MNFEQMMAGLLNRTLRVTLGRDMNPSIPEESRPVIARAYTVKRGEGVPDGFDENATWPLQVTADQAAKLAAAGATWLPMVAASAQ